MRFFLGMILILTTSCTEIFKTEIDIADCSNSDTECSYSESIQPIFTLHCTVCHNSTSPDGGLSLESYNDLIIGNVIDVADSLNSKLIHRITGENSSIMPPPPRDRLEASKIHMISKWIQAGAINN